MRLLGIILTLVGVIWVVIAFNMQTTVRTGGTTIGSGQFSIQVPVMEVKNLGLMDDRRNHLLVGASLTVIGILLFGFGTLVQSKAINSANSGSLKTCPICAESIQKAATKCRYCGSEIAGAIEPPSKQSAANRPINAKGNSTWNRLSSSNPREKVVFAVIVVAVFVALGSLGYALLDLSKANSALTGSGNASQKAMDGASPEAKKLWNDIGSSTR